MLSLRLKLENSERGAADQRAMSSELAERYGEIQRELSRAKAAIQVQDEREEDGFRRRGREVRRMKRKKQRKKQRKKERNKQTRKERKKRNEQRNKQRNKQTKKEKKEKKI